MVRRRAEIDAAGEGIDAEQRGIGARQREIWGSVVGIGDGEVATVWLFSTAATEAEAAPLNDVTNSGSLMLPTFTRSVK